MADVTPAGFEDGSKAEFVVVEDNGLICWVAKLPGPFQAKSVDVDVTEKYKHRFSGVRLLMGYELKLHIDASVKPVV